MLTRTRNPLVSLGLLLLGLTGLPAQCAADVIFVDNQRGDDARGGLTDATHGGVFGPVRTIRRALELADSGDTLVLKNTGQPYYESIELFGPRHSGVRFTEFTIIGNGSVIDGSNAVPPGAWKPVGADLWKFTPWRKGHYQLILDGRLLPEIDVPSDAREVPAMPRGQWCAWKGSIYFHAQRADAPQTRAFRFAARGVGLSLYRVQGVRIRDLTFRWFRLDGANAHNLCSGIVLQDVVLAENGRSGLFCGGATRMSVSGGFVQGNRKHSVLIRGIGSVDIQQTNLDNPPEFVD